jgi:ribosomal protein S18 acetylase RimI-like enzyme
VTDDELYVRGAATLLASWEAYARGSAGAALERLDGVSTAVFPSEPERSVYNNALLERHLAPGHRAQAVDALEASYRSAGIDRYAAWVHESDKPMRAELEGRGFPLAETTRAMGMELADLRVPRPEVELAQADLFEHLRLVGMPPGFLRAADPAAFEVVVARLDGENVATAIALDLDGDRGIYNVGTLEHARRRGLGTALTALLLHDARERGCRTASLQSSQMAERVYAAVGFRDLGRILEYVPGG